MQKEKLKKCVNIHMSLNQFIEINNPNKLIYKHCFIILLSSNPYKHLTIPSIHLPLCPCFFVCFFLVMLACFPKMGVKKKHTSALTSPKGVCASFTVLKNTLHGPVGLICKGVSTEHWKGHDLQSLQGMTKERSLKAVSSSRGEVCPASITRA